MKFLEKIGSIVANYPKWTIFTIALLTILMIGGAILSVSSGRSELRTNINDLFPKYKEVEIMEKIEEDFGNMEPYLILVKADDVFQPKVFNKISQLELALKKDSKLKKHSISTDVNGQVPLIYSLPSILANYKLMKQKGELAPTNKEISTIIKNFKSGDEIKSLFHSYQNDKNISEAERDLISTFLPKDFVKSPYDESVESMVVFIAIDSSYSDEKIEEVELHIKDNIIKNYDGDGITMYSYAFGLLSSSYSEAERTLEPLFSLAILLIFIISLINYKRLSDALLANFTVLLVVIWTFCFIGIVGYDYNYMNIMVPLLITGLAIDFSFHGIIGYRERLYGQEKPEKRVRNAIVAMISFVGIAFILATVTTAFGFLSNISSALPSITEFGIIAALGIVFICLFNLTLVPAIRVVLDLRRLKKGKSLTGIIPPKVISASPGKLLKPFSQTIKFPWFILITLILVLLAIPGYTKVKDIQASYDPTGELLETQDITKAFRTLNKDYAIGTESILMRINGDFEDPSLWQAVNQSIKNASDNKYISKVNGSANMEWIGVLLPSIGRSDPAYQLFDKNLDGLPEKELGPKDIRNTLDNISKFYPTIEQYIHKGANGYDSIVIRVMSKTNVGEFGLEAKKELEKDFKPVYAQGGEIKYTGEPIIWNKGLNDFSDSLISSTVLVMIFAAVLLLIVYGLLYRSPILGLLTAVPSISAVGWTLGIMVLLNIPLNMMTAFVGSLTVGLGIDYPIHLVTRWVGERRKEKSSVQCYIISMRSTGKELLFSALTTLSAFITFYLMPMEVMKQFGIVMVLAITFSFLAAVFMMPLLIRFWHRGDQPVKENLA